MTAAAQRAEALAKLAVLEAEQAALRAALAAEIGAETGGQGMREEQARIVEFIDRIEANGAPLPGMT